MFRSVATALSFSVVFAATAFSVGCSGAPQADEGADLGQATSALSAARAPMCGGFADIQCPAGDECVEDTTDDCDPANGGADCAGVCRPKKAAAPAGATCGGFANLRCPAGQKCVTDPRAVGADRSGTCQDR